MQRFIDAGPTDRLGIYLNDHRGLLAAEHDLARRCHASHSDLEDGDRTPDHQDLVALLAVVIDQNTDDRHRLDEILADVGVRPNPLKTIGARIGERLGRLKLNGQLSGYSPLSRVIEIEALLASTAVRRAMWVALSDHLDSPTADSDATTRAGLVEAQHQALVGHHVEAVSRAFTRQDES